MSAEQAAAVGLEGAKRLREGEIIVDQIEATQIITLNRPAALNAVNQNMQDQIAEVLLAAKTDPSVRVIVITGTGRGFCGGADANKLIASAEVGGADRRGQARAKWTPRWAELYKPTICAVNGVCAGAGLHFVSDCDIVIASTAASFTDTHVNVGQVTALEPLGLSRKMPAGPILRMIILGKAERLTAQQALAVHMISEVVEPDALLPRALELARIASQGSAAALAISLEAFHGLCDLPQSEQDAKALEMLIDHKAHPDAKEGPVAFLEKRPPKWTV